MERYTRSDVECALVRLAARQRRAVIVSTARAKDLASRAGVALASWQPKRGDYGPRVALSIDHSACYGGWSAKLHRPGSSGDYNLEGWPCGLGPLRFPARFACYLLDAMAQPKRPDGRS